MDELEKFLLDLDRRIAADLRAIRKKNRIRITAARKNLKSLKCPRAAPLHALNMLDKMAHWSLRYGTLPDSYLDMLDAWERGRGLDDDYEEALGQDQ